LSRPSLLIPFRLPSPAPELAQGYHLIENGALDAAELNRLQALVSEPPRSAECWQQVLERSSWHFAVVREPDVLVGFVRITSDMALNANLWDLCADPHDPLCPQIYSALVASSLNKLRRELSGCSISLAAPPAALQALEKNGFVIDPGGIRAMGLDLH